MQIMLPLLTLHLLRPSRVKAEGMVWTGIHHIWPHRKLIRLYYSVACPQTQPATDWQISEYLWLNLKSVITQHFAVGSRDQFDPSCKSGGRNSSCVFLNGPLEIPLLHISFRLVYLLLLRAWLALKINCSLVWIQPVFFYSISPDSSAYLRPHFHDFCTRRSHNEHMKLL